MMLSKSDWKPRVPSRCKLWIYWFVKKQRYKISVNLWRFMWIDLQFKSLCRRSRRLLYLTYAAGISPTLILNRNAKAKERGSWVPFKIWKSEVAEAVHIGWCCLCVERNLVKASTLSVSKVRQFLHSKPSYTKFTFATRKFKRMKAFAGFKNEIWCLDLAYVDKLAKDNNGVKYLLVRQDLFDRTVDAKGMKTKDSKGTFRAFPTLITKNNHPRKIWVDKGTDFAGEFRKLFKSKGIQIYCTMSETKAALAERTKRSFKKIVYHYMEDHGYKYIHKLTQFVTTLNSRRNCSIDLIPKNVKNSDFLSILYGKPVRQLRKPKFKIGERVRISKYDSAFRKGFMSQFTQEVFKKVALSSRKPPTYTMKDEQDEINRGKFHQKELNKVI